MAEKIKNKDATYSKLIREDGSVYDLSGDFDLLYETTGTYVYVGQAVPGSATSAAVWRIKRLDTATSALKFADAVTSFTKKWDDRATYAY